MTTPRCDNCKHWDRSDKEWSYVPDNANTHKCLRAKQFWDATEWVEEGDNDVRRVKDPSDKMFVADGSNYRAELLTMADFYCAHFEP